MSTLPKMRDPFIAADWRFATRREMRGFLKRVYPEREHTGEGQAIVRSDPRATLFHSVRSEGGWRVVVYAGGS